MSDFRTTLERNLSALIQDCMHTQQLENLVYQYNQAVKSSLAPITEIRLKGEDRKPWYHDEVHLERRKRRQLERRWRKTRLTVNREMLCTHSKHVASPIKRKKSGYYRNKFSEADHKQTFALLRTLMKVPRHCRAPQKDDKIASLGRNDKSSSSDILKGFIAHWAAAK
ncbi:hypothetical protein CAPTEDRAFT_216332 [Capitella teleta]|uniref:Uncharacterized protein n=1 Tax=Capitella teleta TaxID=283909 RepID=R7T581_CAPTE|nr:hypothetical protein CAPTEDRAFT_216332 [Capitella teleta]|eukprot:ELT88213.1 hypothetical protein CAPTEDRAFT_216332 [Capitella teleta]